VIQKTQRSSLRPVSLKPLPICAVVRMKRPPKAFREIVRARLPGTGGS